MLRIYNRMQITGTELYQYGVRPHSVFDRNRGNVGEVLFSNEVV